MDNVKWIDFRGLYHDFVEQTIVKSCRPPRMKTKGRPQLKQFMKAIYFMKSEAIYYIFHGIRGDLLITSVWEPHIGFYYLLAAFVIFSSL